MGSVAGAGFSEPTSHASFDFLGKAEVWWLPIQEDRTQSAWMGVRTPGNPRGGLAELSPRDPFPPQTHHNLPPHIHLF